MIRPMRKTISAIFSYLRAREPWLRIDKSDNKLLDIKNKIAIAVSSSIKVAASNFKTLTM